MAAILIVAMVKTLVALLLAAVSTAPLAAQHDRAYWRTIKTNKFEVPAGASAPALAAELSTLFASPDPELRDELAFEILASWISEKRVLTPDQIRPLMAAWTANLQRGIGEANNDGVLQRSFSALALSTVAARDTADPFLTSAEHGALLSAALKYLESERDLRGFDDRLGWIHATAHTADLVKFLARSPHLKPADQRAILDAVKRKMRESSVVFTFGEDERLARAIGSIIIRQDFDLDGFRAWVTAIASPPLDQRTTEANLRARQNPLNLLSKLAVLLSRQPTLPPDAEAARKAVLAAAKF